MQVYFQGAPVPPSHRRHRCADLDVVVLLASDERPEDPVEQDDVRFEATQRGLPELASLVLRDHPTEKCCDLRVVPLGQVEQVTPPVLAHQKLGSPHGAAPPVSNGSSAFGAGGVPGVIFTA